MSVAVSVVLLQACDEGGRSGGDDVGVGRGEERWPRKMQMEEIMARMGLGLDELRVVVRNRSTDYD